MQSRSRTTNTIFNFASSIGGQLITLILQFVVRTVFIATLGKSYLGISGLFSNILSLLSLAELGMGSAILYKLYSPIARGDTKTIRILMVFYRKAYMVIGAAVAVIGLCMIPLLPALINDYDKFSKLGLSAALIFCLYLFKSVSSYFFLAYRSAIIKADQKQYIVTLVSYIFTLAWAVFEIALLLLFHNFVLYIAVSCAVVIGQNICCALIATRMYPQVFEKTGDRLPKETVRGILKDCGALFLYKINTVVMKATDNIILSIFMGLDTVALYSNYYIFYTSIFSLFGKIFNSVSHSLGNLHATDNSDHEYRVYETIMFISAVLGGVAFVGIFVCSDEFVDAWLGGEWVLAQPFALLMGLELYTMAFRCALSHYRTSMGLFRQSWFRPVLGVLINIVLSVVLVRVWGICGVLVGTIAADWLAFMWLDPLIVHRYGFGGRYPVSRYYLKFLKNFLVCAAVAALDWFICSHIFTGHGWFSVILHALICAVTVPLALLAVNARSPEPTYVLKIAKRYAGKIKKK